MSNIQPDAGNEKYYWYLKALQEQEQKRKSANQPDNDQEINVLRFVKLLEPTVERLMEICEKELGISLLTASSILEKLEKSKEIQFVEIPDPIKKIVKITEKGLKRLDNGG